MEIKLAQVLAESAYDSLIVGVVGEGDVGRAADILGTETTEMIKTLYREESWRSSYGTVTNLYSWPRKSKHLVLISLGKEDVLTADLIRALAAISIRATGENRSRHVGAVLFHARTLSEDTVIQAMTEGVILGSYGFRYFKTEKKEAVPTETYTIWGVRDISAGAKAADRGEAIAASINLTRDLVNYPGNYLTPDRLAREAAVIAQRYGLEMSVLNKEDMASLGMNALLAVAQGSKEPPKLIVLHYRGNAASSDILGLVGKGITFDSGGISLKPGAGMETMKEDMAGAAAVLGAMAAIARLQLPVNVTALLPCAENMPSGHALKPGDIITSMSGLTIEVVNTDAEGRLILADSLTYAQRLGVTKLVDIATLTGACVIALGNVASGVITNHDDWCQTVLQAAGKVGEKMWQLPNYSEYKRQLKSNVADLKNTGGRSAGTITAGLFLAAFAGDVPWVHIDIAGTVTAEKTRGYHNKGATGIGVATLVQLAEDLSKKI